MREHTLCAYVEGSEFTGVAEELAARFSRFVADRHWISGEAWAVNQRREDDDSMWELGMNLELPNPHEEPEGWFEDVEAIAVFLRDLAIEFELQFVVGAGVAKRGVAENLFLVDSGPIDIEALQAIIGVAPP